MNTRNVILATLALLGASSVSHAQLRVVTSSTDLHDIAKAVGGEWITASHIAQGYQDPHFVEAKPSFVLQLQKADVWAYVGLDLEVGWMPLLIDGARNEKIRLGGSGHVDVSKAIPVLDVPRGPVDRSQGDVHPLGNPHYWLDPSNGRRIAKLFVAKFAELDPSHAGQFAANEQAFDARLTAAERVWAGDVAAIRGKPIVAWHTSWNYFAAYTGASIIGYMEPKPGVPPSPSHIAALVDRMKATGAKVIIMETFYDRKLADLVASRTGARVLVLPPSVDPRHGVNSYIELLQKNIAQVAAAVR
jgi:ABC-type Zn uptake system ZnuABC Zn-binding protein ZnuA